MSSGDEGSKHTPTKKSTAEKRKTPVGADGLTKYQRHYRKKKLAVSIFNSVLISLKKERHI